LETVIVIPARYGSTRFPGKPLAEIAGHSLVSRVIDIAQKACAATINTSYVVATDHEDIKSHAEACGAPAVMTDPELPSGSDRALVAANMFAPSADFVIGLQGDAPFTPHTYVSALIEEAAESETDVVTPVLRLSWDALDMLRKQKESYPFSGTTCIRLDNGRAVWFSKNILPAIRKEEKLRTKSDYSPVFRHVGLYGYRKDALERFTKLPLGHYEEMEGLEQLRFLENGMTVQAVEVQPYELSMWGVDEPEDAELAAELIAKHGDPMTSGV